MKRNCVFFLVIEAERVDMWWSDCMTNFQPCNYEKEKMKQRLWGSLYAKLTEV